ncbi:hypothetical protein EF096_01715 [Pseudomonas neustonica]|uniref:HNH endonuclease n=1 Tax=Pseudomonas neustonica TaxID=2487346 RepID=A0ABX9XN12_9PSED|nr:MULTISPECIES: hypothetical protein [Pseudomonas]ROZ86951.1 hypothetical protein EF099_00985 [Pseudomonas sp. SSM44]ROZ88433.1 hypothetical protein EF096_01715 [Pseudomonas neustonica]
MTPQLTARPPEPRIYIRVDQWMTEADLVILCNKCRQRINDARSKQQALVPELIPSQEHHHD